MSLSWIWQYYAKFSCLINQLTLGDMALVLVDFYMTLVDFGFALGVFDLFINQYYILVLLWYDYNVR